MKQAKAAGCVVFVADKSWDLSWHQGIVLAHSCCRVEVIEQANLRERELKKNACWGGRVLARDMMSLRMAEGHGLKTDLEEIWLAPNSNIVSRML